MLPVVRVARNTKPGNQRIETPGILGGYSSRTSIRMTAKTFYSE